MLNNHWGIAFGVAKPPSKQKKERNLNTRKIVGTSRRTRAFLDQEILALLNQGIDSNDEIYDLLKQANKLPDRDGQLMAFSTIVYKIQKVRRENGLSKREKQPKIIEMIKQGIDKEAIIKEMKISRSYFCQVVTKIKWRQNEQ